MSDRITPPTTGVRVVNRRSATGNHHLHLLLLSCGLALSLAACSQGVTPIRTAFNRGVYHQQQGELAAAAADFKRAVNENPDDFRARINLGLAYEALARRDAPQDPQASAQFTQLAREQYQHVLSQRPEHMRAMVNLAALDAEAGHIEAARERLDAAVRIDPRATEPKLALATLAMREGDFTQAAASLREVLANDPGHVYANVLMGDVQLKRDQPAEALGYFELAVASQPTSRSALLSLGQTQLVLDQPTNAMSTARRLLLLDPDHVAGHALAAAAAERLEDAQAAVYHLWQIQHAVPAKAQPRFNLRLAALYQQLLRDVTDAPPATQP